MSALPSNDNLCRQYYYFQAVSEKKTVSHKPHVLDVRVKDGQGEQASFSISVKISQAKIKRRSNITEDLDAVWMTALAPLEILTKKPASLHEQKVTMQLSPDVHVPANHQGFLVYVETKGGKTEGRQQQRYVLLRKDAIYTLSCITPFVIISLKLTSRKGDEHSLNFWPEPNDTNPRANPNAVAPMSSQHRAQHASPSAPTGLTTLSSANKVGKMEDVSGVNTVGGRTLGSQSATNLPTSMLMPSLSPNASNNNGRLPSQPFLPQLTPQQQLQQQQQQQQLVQPHQQQQRQQLPQAQPQQMMGASLQELELQRAVRSIPDTLPQRTPAAGQGLATHYRVTSPSRYAATQQPSLFNMPDVDPVASSWMMMPATNIAAAASVAGPAPAAVSMHTGETAELFMKTEGVSAMLPINRPYGASATAALEEFDRVNWDNSFAESPVGDGNHLWPSDIGLNFDLANADDSNRGLNGSERSVTGTDDNSRSDSQGRSRSNSGSLPAGALSTTTTTPNPPSSSSSTNTSSTVFSTSTSISASTSTIAPAQSSSAQSAQSIPPQHPEKRSSFFFNRNSKIKLSIPNISIAMADIAHRAAHHFSASSQHPAPGCPAGNAGAGATSHPSHTGQDTEAFPPAPANEPLLVNVSMRGPPGWHQDSPFSPKAVDSPASSIVSPPRKRRIAGGEGATGPPDFVLQPTMWNVARATDTVCKAKLFCFTPLQLNQCSVVIELGGKVIFRQAAPHNMPNEDMNEDVLSRASTGLEPLPRISLGEMGNGGSVESTPRGSDMLLSVRSSAGLLEMRTSQNYLSSPMRNSSLLAVKEGEGHDSERSPKDKDEEEEEERPSIKVEASYEGMIRNMSGDMEAMSLENTPRGAPGGPCTSASAFQSKSGFLSNMPSLQDKLSNIASMPEAGGSLSNRPSLQDKLPDKLHQSPKHSPKNFTMTISTSSHPSSLNNSPFSPIARTLSGSQRQLAGDLLNKPRDSEGSDIMPDTPSNRKPALSIAFHVDSNYVAFKIPLLHPGETLSETTHTWPAGTSSFILPLSVRIDGAQHFTTQFTFTYVPEGSHAVSMTPPSLKPQPSPMGASPELGSAPSPEMGTLSRSHALKAPGSGRSITSTCADLTDSLPTSDNKTLGIQKRTDKKQTEADSKGGVGAKRGRQGRTGMTAKEASLDVYLAGLFQDSEVSDAFQHMVEKYLNGYYTLVPAVADSPRRHHAQSSQKTKHLEAWFRATTNPVDRAAFIKDALRHICNVMIVQQRVNRYDSRGWTPLHYIGGLGLCELTSLLLKNGANALQLNRDGKVSVIALCRSRCALLQARQGAWLCSLEEAMQTLRLLQASEQHPADRAATIATVSVHRNPTPLSNPTSPTNTGFVGAPSSAPADPSVKLEFPSNREQQQQQLQASNREQQQQHLQALQQRLISLDQRAHSAVPAGSGVSDLDSGHPPSTTPYSSQPGGVVSVMWRPPLLSLPSKEKEKNTVLWSKGVHFGPPSCLTDTSAKAPTGVKYALLVALDKYAPTQSHLPACQGQVRNALHHLPILQQAHGYSCVLLDNEKATQQAMAREVRRLHAAAAPGDAVVVYFTGHTTQDSLCLYDGALPFLELQHALAAMRTAFVSVVIEAISVRASPIAG